MIRLKLILVCFLIAISCNTYAQHTDEINSNRPGETMSAFAVGKTVFQVETGVYGIRQKHDLLKYDSYGFGVDAMLRYGLLAENLEFIADLQYQNETVNNLFSTTKQADFKQIVLGAKYLLYDPFKNYERKVNLYSYKAKRAFNLRQLLPAISVFAGANITMKDNPYAFSPQSSVSPKVMLITQNHLGDGRWVFVTNVIADYIGSEFPSYGYVLTLTRGFNRKWSGFVENQGYKSDFYSDAIVRGGAAYLLNEDMQIDASLSSSLKNTPAIAYGGIGFSWRYDAKHKEVRIKKKDPKANNKKSKSKKRNKNKK